MSPSSHEIAIMYVTDRVRSGVWKPGERLPTIRELAALAGVSETAVKTALIVLRERGVVTSRQGAGIYAGIVVDPTATPSTETPP